MTHESTEMLGRSDRIEQMPKNKTECEPGTVSCTKVHCRHKVEQFEHTVMGCHFNSLHCDDDTYEDKLIKCIKQCCRGDFCNDLSDTWPPADWSSGVIGGLHTSFGICSVVFAVLFATIYSEFVKWF
ncbi:hypothetical protein niasHS_009778 [Heterodera schachtii]|uniref:Uncharacterized protein n=2 Tax=Heterodera TaxID=34509 RepID=A0ABD2J2E5_HETSC